MGKVKIVLLLLTFSFFSCEERVDSKMVSASGHAFGTTYNIKFYAPVGSKSIEVLNEAVKGIDSVIYRVNKSVSTYMPNSDISKINKGDTTVVVDAIFKEVYRISETVYANSKGMFDPTVGVLRNAYGFGDTKPLKEIDSTTLDSLRKFVGFRKVKLLGSGKIRKQYPEIYFDFNAVAKGYAIDLLGRYLEEIGIDNYVIELGGEVLARGQNLNRNRSWTAGVESVTSDLDNRQHQALLKIENRAMAGSGNYRKFRIDPVSGKKYVHTINPHTGKAEERSITSANVLAPNCALADAYATAFMAMGLENAKRLLPALDEVEAYLTYRDENNEPQIYITEGFKEVMLED